MAVTERTATVTIAGDMRVTNATIEGDSGVRVELPGSLVERLDAENGKTSPEELIASAYAGDYAMTLASALSTHGNQPEQLEVRAKCILNRTPDGLAISRIELSVKGVVPRIDQAHFEELARKVEEKCIVSTAMRGNVEFGLTAELVDAVAPGAPGGDE